MLSTDMPSVVGKHKGVTDIFHQLKHLWAYNSANERNKCTILYYVANAPPGGHIWYRSYFISMAKRLKTIVIFLWFFAGMSIYFIVMQCDI